jgi:rare lipoprotein A
MNMKVLFLASAALTRLFNFEPDEVIGRAAWMGRECEGQIMSDGTKFDRYSSACASWFYPLGTELKVTCLQTGRSVTVTVRTRGPDWRLVKRENRIIDLSEWSFSRICKTELGVTMVSIERVIPVLKPEARLSGRELGWTAQP